MQNFIYVLDEQLKEKLLAKQYKLLKETKINNKIAYVFIDNCTKFNFSKEDKTKYILSNKLTF